MDIVNSIPALRECVNTAKRNGKVVGFVPTMGNLHEGHLSLIDKALEKADFVVSSIFVNPMQFGANEDLDKYPRTLEADARALAQRGCHLLFTPTVNEMYPHGLEKETKVDVPFLGEHHCGASRPGHFTGVSTVVTKLFNMVQPDLAVFGEKDYQQLAIIRKMTKDLCLPIEIIGLPTSRESSGLARSSRNGFLTESEKDTGSLIYALLQETAAAIANGNNNFDELKQNAQKRLEEAGFRNDYFNIANGEHLGPAKPDDSNIVILVAAHLGQTRLIDNITILRD